MGMLASRGVPSSFSCRRFLSPAYIVLTVQLAQNRFLTMLYTNLLIDQMCDHHAVLLAMGALLRFMTAQHTPQDVARLGSVS